MTMQAQNALRSVASKKLFVQDRFSRSTRKRIQLGGRTEKYHSSSRFDF
jgi:hypothetical protein